MERGYDTTRRAVLLTALLGLAACDTGTPEFWDLPPTRVEALGMAFDVRVRGTRAEALRQNVMLRPRDQEVAAAAAIAIAQVSGCQVRSLSGDPSIVQADLDCRSAAPRAMPPPTEQASPALRCEGEILSRPAIDLEEITLDCR